MYTFTFSQLYLMPKIYTMLGWVQQVSLPCLLFVGILLPSVSIRIFFFLIELIICWKLNAMRLFSTGCTAKTNKKKNTAIAYGGFVICGYNKTMVWLLTPAAVLQRSSDITAAWAVAPSAARCHRLVPDSNACLVFSVWRVGRVRQASLPLAHVPVQALRQALEPIVNQVMATDGGHRVAGCGDLDAAEGEHQHQGPRGATQTAV